MKEQDDGIVKLDFNDEFLLDSVENYLDEGDYLNALTMINKRNSMYAPSADAEALAADVYEAMELYPLAADAWFRFLDTCNEADFSEGYEGLAVAFMNMGNDLHSSLYYRRFWSEEGGSPEELEALFESNRPAPMLRMVYSAEGEAPEVLAEGLAYLKMGDLGKAKEVFAAITEESDDYATAAGLSSMCTLMQGNEEEALAECAGLVEQYPENIQALTTYCAIMGAMEKREEAKEIARRLARISTSAVDDLYRIATALCETGLDEEAHEKLCILREHLPYDENILYFLAVSSYRTGRLEEAIDALEVLTTVYPRKAVAGFYLTQMRLLRDKEREPFTMSYFYRLPEEDYNTVAGFLLAAEKSDALSAVKNPGELSSLTELFRVAFDEMEGRDEKLQMLAARVAAKLKQDTVLREVLLTYDGDDVMKLHILRELSLRNENDSFGTVICNLYKEFYTHQLDIGPRKQEEFMQAFADVYSKFALINEDSERKICLAAEDIYATLEENDAWELMDDRASLAAAIYREARLPKGEHAFSKIVDLFKADKGTTQQILDYMI